MPFYVCVWEVYFHLYTGWCCVLTSKRVFLIQVAMRIEETQQQQRWLTMNFVFTLVLCLRWLLALCFINLVPNTRACGAGTIVEETFFLSSQQLLLMWLQPCGLCKYIIEQAAKYSKSVMVFPGRLSVYIWGTVLYHKE